MGPPLRGRNLLMSPPLRDRPHLGGATALAGRAFRRRRSNQGRLVLNPPEGFLIISNYLIDLRRKHDIDEHPRGDPLRLVREHLGKDVRWHALAAFMSKKKLSGLVSLMNPTHTNTMCSWEVTHCRVSARLYTLKHGLIVLKKPHLGCMRQQTLPQLQGGTPNHAQRVASRNHLSLGSRIRHTTLSLAKSQNRPTGSRTSDAEVHSCCGPLC